MSYLERTLQPGETIVHQTSVHWIVYLPAVVIAGFGIWALAEGNGGGSGFLYTAGMGLVALALVLGVIAWIQRVSTEMAITNRRVIAKFGFVWRKTYEIDRSKVESVNVDQSILGRILDYGTITVTGTGSSSAPVRDIDSPLEFRNKLLAG